jgi:hypothetical protein
VSTLSLFFRILFYLLIVSPLQEAKNKKVIDPNMKECGNCSVQETMKFKVCGRCKAMWYCGRECQSAHWKSSHKKLCILIEERKVPQQQYVDNRMGRLLIKDESSIPCAICLEDVSSETDCLLPCSHLFHLKCLSNLRAADSVANVCPLCRTDLPPGPEDSFNKGFKLYLKTIFASMNDHKSYSITHKQEIQDMIDLLSAAGNEGHVQAQATLGEIYHVGQMVTSNIKTSFGWYQKAAEQGHAQAQNSLGFMLNNAEGVTQNIKEAAMWYRKAAEQGLAQAQFNLGIMLDNGKGVTQNQKEAAMWYRKAAEQGDAQAQFNLGFIFDNGK